jgi:hypothetical protein
MVVIDNGCVTCWWLYLPTYTLTISQTDLPYWSKISLPWWVGCGTSEVDRGCEGSAEEGMQMFDRVDAFWNLLRKETTTNGPYYDGTLREAALN